jgi:hypothetical protein
MSRPVTPLPRIDPDDDESEPTVDDAAIRVSNRPRKAPRK